MPLPGVEPDLRPSQSRVHPPHSKDKMVFLSLNARTTLDDKAFVIAHQKYPTEESNLARLLRRQSCVLHTRRACISIPTWNRTRAWTFEESNAIPLHHRDKQNRRLSQRLCYGKGGREGSCDRKLPPIGLFFCIEISIDRRCTIRRSIPVKCSLISNS
jgi:hypothetical protein